MKNPLSWLLGAIASSAAALAATQGPTVLPAAPSLVGGSDPIAAFTLKTAANAEAAVKFETVSVEGPGFTQAWRVATLQDEGQTNAIELRASNGLPVAKGDVAMIRFFARSTVISDETASGRMLVVVRGNGAKYNSSYEGDFSLNRDWQEILIPFVFIGDYPAGEASIMLRFGYKRQTVEIGGLQVLDYGKGVALAALPRTRFSYEGHDPGAAWRKEALERIARIREDDVSVKVMDASGNPASGAEVHVEMVKSAFKWGSALQMWRLVQDTPENQIYRSKFLEFFNAGSTENDLKWPVWLGEWDGKYSQSQTLAGLHWMKDHGLYVRGHVMVWPGRNNLPAPITSRLGTPQQGEIPALIEAHIREMARATRGLVSEWDVLNEPFTNHDLMDAFGPEIMVSWFKTAREELPNAGLFLNDFSNHDSTTDAAHVDYFEHIADYLLKHGAPLTGLGVQAHFGGRPNAPEHILAALDRYTADFHLPIRITEFDVSTYDEELQSDFTRDFLILCFSHPSVVGVQFWGFWAGAHWRPASALFREDWTERPAAKVYRDLVLGKWRTNETLRTDPRGLCALRGFQGDYRVTISYKGKQLDRTLTLPPQATPVQLNITLP